MLRFEVMI